TLSLHDALPISPDELHKRAGLRGLVVFLAEQEPREAGDGIRLVAVRIGDRYPEIGVETHPLHRASRCGGDALEGGCDELAGLIAHATGRKLVDHGVTQLDVADRARRLLHAFRHALVTL